MDFKDRFLAGEFANLFFLLFFRFIENFTSLECLLLSYSTALFEME